MHARHPAVPGKMKKSSAAVAMHAPPLLPSKKKKQKNRKRKSSSSPRCPVKTKTRRESTGQWLPRDLRGHFAAGRSRIPLSSPVRRKKKKLINESNGQDEKAVSRGFFSSRVGGEESNTEGGRKQVKLLANFSVSLTRFGL